ncbi:helix-turn-helix domain-containing protein [Micromonospora soli]|uniref:winged helix-turn-helix domain-containing protein n=1 Tax=Micromonospora sp. NBRC 110009 TaxID=3061627 RepID=UPI00267263DB|nr:helix-turn-helix domain-containing protein [Micromonospora sp. NBRC 110009]WKT98113.1 helix-turn-helix domain-containing protein [Micromonospora sp. NBRC 110009]
MTDEPETLHLTDPRAMRALAHPTRLRLLGELRVRGPQTVGMLSEVVDEAVGSVSYHLGKLAEHGFVREAPELARNRRERWWRAAHARTNWEPIEALGDPERKAASDLLRRAVLDRYVDRLRAYLDAEATLDPEWVRGTASSDSWLHLTSDELVELRTDLEALAARWQARSDPDRPDARTVTLIYHTFRDPR